MSSYAKNAAFTVLFAAAALLLYFYSSLLSTKEKQNLPDKGTYTSHGFSGTLYQQDGTRYRSLSADVAVFHEKDKLYDFQNPLVRSYRVSNSGQVEVWAIRSKTGQAREGDFVDMKGGVTAVPEHQGSQVQKFTTSTLHYDIKTGFITSPDPTTIYGEGWIDSGTGFSYDSNKNIMRFSDNVHSTYYNNPGSGSR
ncbi:MAG: LPS export ABC transporter periplasmic protein LptC [Succinivibrio sp.]